MQILQFGQQSESARNMFQAHFRDVYHGALGENVGSHNSELWRRLIRTVYSQLRIMDQVLTRGAKLAKVVKQCEKAAAWIQTGSESVNLLVVVDSHSDNLDGQLAFHQAQGGKLETANITDVSREPQLQGSILTRLHRSSRPTATRPSNRQWRVAAGSRRYTCKSAGLRSRSPRITRVSGISCPGKRKPPSVLPTCQTHFSCPAANSTSF